MKRRPLLYSNVLFWAVYGVFTVLCIVLCSIFPQCRGAFLAAWYAGTLAAWGMTAIQLLMLLAKLKRIRKVKEQLNHKRRKDDPS